MSLSLSIERASLSLAPLTVGPGLGGLYTLAGEGQLRPAYTWRRVYAGSSPWIDGATLVSAAKEQSTLPVEILVRAASTAALTTAQDDLEESVSQFIYETTATEDGVAVVWSCDPADLAWQQSKAYRLRHWATALLVIPVHPIPVGA